MGEKSQEIRVTCHAADLLPIDSLIEFQGDLKNITPDNLEKLKRSILRHGFTAPIFVWKGVDNHIIDGHQRLKALIQLRQEGYVIPLLPIAYIDADSEKHAKEKLLYITSQYGDFSTDGFFEFTDDLEVDFSEIALGDSGRMYFDSPGDIDSLFLDSDEQPDEEEKEVCPHCGQVMP